jgi:hypothetical protein
VSYDVGAYDDGKCRHRTRDIAQTAADSLLRATRSLASRTAVGSATDGMSGIEAAPPKRRRAEK